MSAAFAVQVVQVLTERLDEVPVDKDVKAGWTAFVVFLLLIAAVVVLAFSFVKQLRKTEAARQAGVFGPPDDGPGKGRRSSGVAPIGVDTGAEAATDADTEADSGSEPRQAP